LTSLCYLDRLALRCSVSASLHGGQKTVHRHSAVSACLRDRNDLLYVELDVKLYVGLLIQSHRHGVGCLRFSRHNLDRVVFQRDGRSADCGRSTGCQCAPRHVEDRRDSSIATSTPACLRNLTSVAEPTRHLRSARAPRLSVPRKLEQELTLPDVHCFLCCRAVCLDLAS